MKRKGCSVPSVALRVARRTALNGYDVVDFLIAVGHFGDHQGDVDTGDGLESLKSFCLRATRRQQGNSLVRPRGVLLLSPAGCGKSPQ